MACYFNSLLEDGRKGQLCHVFTYHSVMHQKLPRCPGLPAEDDVSCVLDEVPWGRQKPGHGSIRDTRYCIHYQSSEECYSFRHYCKEIVEA